MVEGRIAAAARLAAERHAGQWRKGPPGIPYVEHCREVAALVAEHGGDEKAVVAAWLHDAVEKTATTGAEIAARFGPAVAALVAELTDDPGLDEAEARAEQVRAAPDLSPAAALVKAADQTANLRALAEAPPGAAAERAAYLTKARAVVEQLRAPEALKAVFRETADAVERIAGKLAQG